MYNDEYFMRIAIQEAKMALDKGEIPIGAVITHHNVIIAKSHNQTEQLKDFTAHAEMLAFTSASEYLSNKYLNECTLYVTLEPCPMCAAASNWTQLGKIVFGASDPNKGFQIYKPLLLHPKTTLKFGVLETECLNLLQDFFNSKRKS